MSYEYYVTASFPSGYREVMIFSTRAGADKQAQKYADRGAWRATVRREAV